MTGIEICPVVIPRFDSLIIWIIIHCVLFVLSMDFYVHIKGEHSYIQLLSGSAVIYSILF